MTINPNYAEKEILDYLYKQMTEEDVQVFEAEMLSNPELTQQVSAMTLMLLINEHPRNLYPVSAPIDDDTRRFVLDIIKPPPSLVENFLMLPLTPIVSGLPHSGVPYFFVPQTYDTSLADELLAPHNVACPNFKSYVGNLLKFVKKHPKL